MIMWLTKCEECELYLWTKKPERGKEAGEWIGDYKDSCWIEANIWPRLRCSSEPLELDLVVSSEENGEEKKDKITMWLTRDKDGELYIWTKEPTRAEIKGSWDPSTLLKRSEMDGFWFQSNIWPSLKWEDRPLKIDLVIQKAKAKKK